MMNRGHRTQPRVSVVSVAVALVGLVGVGGACGTQTGEQPDPQPQPQPQPDGGYPPVQMNDVSILFPLGASTSLGSGYLSASSAGSRGVLLPSRLYDAVGRIAGSGGPPPAVGGTATAAYPDLRVVALRIDPCFATLQPDPHGGACTNQLRVVIQELTAGSPGDGTLQAFDSALHVFYQLSREDLLDLVHAIGTLRVAQSTGQRLGGLGPHPIMVSQGLTGAMADGLRQLVLRYAGAKNLIRVTTMSASNAGFQWEFSGFDVRDAEAAAVSPMLIAGLPAGTTHQKFFRGFGATDIVGSFTPETTSADDLAPLADVQAAPLLAPSVRQAAFDSLVRIENPTRHSPDTIDCASCHLAMPIATLIAAPMFSLEEAGNPGLFVPDGVHILSSEMAPTSAAVRDKSASVLDLHAFSYFGATPTVNQRTVNETAAIVQYLSALTP